MREGRRTTDRISRVYSEQSSINERGNSSESGRNTEDDEINRFSLSEHGAITFGDDTKKATTSKGDIALSDESSGSNRWSTKLDEKHRTSKKKSGKIQSLGDIVKDIRDKFDIPISTDKVTRRDARGMDDWNEMIESTGVYIRQIYMLQI